MLGSAFRQSENQYVANRDKNGVWRIINLYHPELEKFNSAEDIPDDSPFIKLLTEGEFLALMAEVKRLGFLQKMEESGDFTVATDAYEKALEENKDLKEQITNKEIEINNLKTNAVEKHSEVFDLATKKLDAIKYLADQDKLDIEIVDWIAKIGGNEDVKE